MGPTVTRPVQDPLTVLLLDNLINEADNFITDYLNCGRVRLSNGTILPGVHILTLKRYYRQFKCHSLDFKMTILPFNTNFGCINVTERTLTSMSRIVSH